MSVSTSSHNPDIRSYNVEKLNSKINGISDAVISMLDYRNNVIDEDVMDILDQMEMLFDFLKYEYEG